VDYWLASESSDDIWRVWVSVPASSDEWCDLAKQVTIAVLAGKDAKQIANNVMRYVFLKEFNIWRKA
jgi:hypothetical protein